MNSRSVSVERNADVLRLRNDGGGQGSRAGRDAVSRQHIDGECVGDGERFPTGRDGQIRRADADVDRAGEACGRRAGDDAARDAASPVRSGGEGKADRRKVAPVGQRRRVDQVGGRGLIIGEGGDERQEQVNGGPACADVSGSPISATCVTTIGGVVDAAGARPALSEPRTTVSVTPIGVDVSSPAHAQREVSHEIRRRERRAGGAGDVDPAKPAAAGRDDLYCHWKLSRRAG